MTSTLTVRMDSDLKREFTEIVESLGLDAPTVVRMLAKQTVQRKTIPLSLSVQPNDEAETMGFMNSIRADWGTW